MKFKAVDFSIVKTFGIFVVVGVVFGTIFAISLKTSSLLLLFSIMTMIFAIYFLLEKEKIETEIYDPNFFPNFPINKTFDLVISTETFEHFRNPMDDIKKAVNSISPSGFLAVMTRFYPLEQNKPCKKSFTEWYYQRDPTHIAFYTSKTFEWLTKIFGLSIILDNGFDFALFKKSLSK